MKTKIFFVVIMSVLLLGLVFGILNKERQKTVMEKTPLKTDAVAFLFSFEKYIYSPLRRDI